MTTATSFGRLVLAAATTWITLVVAQRGLDTGEWATTIRDALVLVSLTAGLATLAARLDMWIEELLGPRVD
ncbi:hypothetical protein [Euzebya sp.]|uniref:hypothetical protein n=1 Tax=Euzebya sp. TaxID=1971409 RepID=UPI003511B56C